MSFQTWKHSESHFGQDVLPLVSSLTPSLLRRNPGSRMDSNSQQVQLVMFPRQGLLKGDPSSGFHGHPGNLCRCKSTMILSAFPPFFIP